MARLSGPQIEELHRTMLDAFDFDALRQFLLFRFDRRLDQIVSPNDDLNAAVFEVIQTANNEGWVDELVTAFDADRDDYAAQSRARFETAQAEKPLRHGTLGRAGRLMPGALVLIAVAVAAWAGVTLPGALPRLRGEATSVVAEWRCEPPDGVRPVRVVVADFSEPAEGSILEDRLFDSLTEGIKREANGMQQICRRKLVIGNRAEAEALGRDTKAAIVVWGRRDRDVYDVHVENMAAKLPELKLRPMPAEAASGVFQIREPSRLTFLTEFIASEILYSSGEAEAARALLSSALTSAEDEKLSDDSTDNAKYMAEAYFFLGYLFDPDDSELPDAEQARRAYTRAIELDPELHMARLNRGLVHAGLDQIEQAEADFTFLIEAGSKLAGAAAGNRASLHVEDDRPAAERDLALAIQLDPLLGYDFRGIARLDWNDPAGAASDFQELVKLAPDDPDNRHMLGMAQLLAGQSEAAEGTYREVIPYLDEQARDGMIEELKGLADEHPDLEAAVSSIVRLLSAAALR